MQKVNSVNYRMVLHTNLVIRSSNHNLPSLQAADNQVEESHLHTNDYKHFSNETVDLFKEKDRKCLEHYFLHFFKRLSLVLKFKKIGGLQYY